MMYTRFDSPLCEIILAGNDDGLKYLHLNTGEGKRGDFTIPPSWIRNDSYFTEAVRQIREYLEGQRSDFDLKLAPEGTAFQLSVWNLLRAIPRGETRTYGELARLLGRPAASRAVGAANGKNPIALIIPCHRVVGSNGGLTGYAHGIGMKEKLLKREGAF